MLLLRICPRGAPLWIASLQTVQWVLSLGVGGMLRRAGYWGPPATLRRVPGVLLPVEARLSLMDLTQHGCISLPVPILEDSPQPRDLVLFARRLVGWNASGEFAAAFPTVSVYGDVVTA